MVLLLPALLVIKNWHPNIKSILFHSCSCCFYFILLEMLIEEKETIQTGVWCSFPYISLSLHMPCTPRVPLLLRCPGSQTVSTVPTPASNFVAKGCNKMHSPLFHRTLTPTGSYMPRCPITYLGSSSRAFYIHMFVFFSLILL